MDIATYFRAADAMSAATTASTPLSAACEEWYKVVGTAYSGQTPPRADELDMSAAWRMLLFGDGSPTRLFSVLTEKPMTVDVIDVAEVSGLDGAPEEVAGIGSPRMRRRVWLTHGGDGTRLGYAVSWWQQDDMRKHMPDASQPIGTAMSTAKLEVHRQLLCVVTGTCPALAAAFSEPHVRAPDGSTVPPTTAVATDEVLWSRYYIMWKGGVPLCLIYEAFSPALTQWLGPVTRTVAPAAAVAQAEGNGANGGAQ